MSIETQWFRGKLAEKQISQRGLARYLGLDSAAVSLMLRGMREMKITEAAMIANLLGVSTEEVVTHAGAIVTRGPKPVPIIGTADGHAQVFWVDDIGTVPRPTGDLPLNLAAIQCRTSSTNLDYMDRWILFIPTPADNGEVRPECIDRLSVVRPRGGESCVAQVRRGYAPGKWNLNGPGMHLSEIDLDYAAPILLIST